MDENKKTAGIFPGLFRDRFTLTVMVVTLLVVGLMAAVRTGRRGAGRKPAVAPGAAERTAAMPPAGTSRVAGVVDGDTLVLAGGETVRLLGIDAPEVHHPELPVQRFGQEAAEFLRRLAEGRECRLEYEPGETRDGYGRLLAWVYVDGKMLNAEMVRRGYAYVYHRYPFRCRREFLLLEQEARQNRWGLWDFSLRDGRIANLVTRYESLTPEGREKLDECLQRLAEEYPLAGGEEKGTEAGDAGK